MEKYSNSSKSAPLKSSTVLTYKHTIVWYRFVGFHNNYAVFLLTVYIDFGLRNNSEL